MRGHRLSGFIRKLLRLKQDYGKHYRFEVDSSNHALPPRINVTVEPIVPTEGNLEVNMKVYLADIKGAIENSSLKLNLMRFANVTVHLGLF